MMEVLGQFGLLLLISASWFKIIHVVESGLAAKLSVAKPGCQETCGNITIPFPFGIGPSRACFLDKWYEIDCNNNNATQIRIPRLKKVGLEVLDISLPSLGNTIAGYRMVGEMRVKIPISYWSSKCSSDDAFQRPRLESTDLRGSNFYYSIYWNRFLVAGCSNLAFLNDTKNTLVQCQTKCNAGSNTNSSNDDIWELDSCMNTIPSNLQAFNINFQN